MESKAPKTIKLSSYQAIKPRLRRAQSIIALTLFIGIIIVLVGTTLAFLTNSFLSSTTSFRYANRAETNAQAGIEDALLQLARNKDFASTGYTIPVASDTASVSVTQNTPVTNEITIVSSSTISFGFSGQRTIQVIVTKDSTTGQINVISTQQQ